MESQSLAVFAPSDSLRQLCERIDLLDAVQRLALKMAPARYCQVRRSKTCAYYHVIMLQPNKCTYCCGLCAYVMCLSENLLIHFSTYYMYTMYIYIHNTYAVILLLNIVIIIYYNNDWYKTLLIKLTRHVASCCTNHYESLWYIFKLNSISAQLFSIFCK